jgi:flavin-dependent dehydrogenase
MIENPSFDGCRPMLSVCYNSLLSRFKILQVRVSVQTPDDQQEEMQAPKFADAVVVGGGLAGLAAAIHLARAGLQVICLEKQQHFQAIVGESLDWSAPDLLSRLGQEMEELVTSGSATYKRQILLTSRDGEQREYLPGEWLADAPWHVEVRTLHLDRMQIHNRLMDTARAAGVCILHDRVLGFERAGSRVLAVRTAHHGHISARWFVDASGGDSSMLAREFRLPAVSYGPRKVAIWAHVPSPEWAEGTTLYMLGASSEYMSWMWEIPIRPGVSSLGYVAPGSEIKRQRGEGKSSAQILETHAHRIARWDGTQSVAFHRVYTTSFLCRTLVRSCGVNWIIVGEAASQSDPITGNGVTAALRHAEEGSTLILRHRTRGRLPALAVYVYNLRVLEIGKFFNSLIEKIFYRPELRSQIGIFLTARIYTVPAWLANLAYTRLRPRSLPGTVAFCSMLAGVRLACWIAFGVSRLLVRRRSRSATAALPMRGDDALRA